MAEIEVRVEGTPNPHAAKFTLDRPLPVQDSRSYFDPGEAEGDPLAEGLFGIEGVRALLMVDNFVTVTKSEEKEWDDLVDEVAAVIRRELDGEDGGAA